MRTLTILLLIGLLTSACTTEGGDTPEGEAPDNALEGEFPPECGSADSSSDLNDFAYHVDDLAGCNDIQVFSFEFDFEDGPALEIDHALTSGRVEVRLTNDDGEEIEEEYEGEGGDWIYAPGADDSGMPAGAIEVRLLFAEATGSLDISTTLAEW
jgi:hypothetical protein